MRIPAVLLALFFLMLFAVPSYSSWEAARFVAVSDTLATAEILEFTGHDHAATRRSALFRVRFEGVPAVEAAAVRALDDPVWSVRRMAARVLQNIATEPSTRDALIRVSVSEDSPQVRSNTVRALLTMPGAEDIPETYVVALLNDASFVVRGTAAKYAFNRPGEEVEAALEHLRTDSFEYVRVRASESLSKLNSDASMAEETAVDPVAASSPDLGEAARRAVIAFVVAALIGAPLVLIQRRKGTVAAFLSLGIVVVLGILVIAVLLKARTPTALETVTVLVDPGLIDHPYLPRGTADIEEVMEVVRASGLPLKFRYQIARENILESSYNHPRNQFDIRKIITEIPSPAPAEAYLLLTNADMYYEPFYAIGGYAQGRKSVASGIRLDPLYLGTAARDDSGAAEVFKTRLGYLIAHEIGHQLGLDHCSSKGCIMQSVEEAADAYFGVEGRLCELCGGES